MTTRSGPIFSADLLAHSALSGIRARFTAVFRTRFHRKQDCRSAELGRVGVSCSLPVRWELETSLGTPHKTSLYSIRNGTASIPASPEEYNYSDRQMWLASLPFAVYDSKYTSAVFPSSD